MHERAQEPRGNDTIEPVLADRRGQQETSEKEDHGA